MTICKRVYQNENLQKGLSEQQLAKQFNDYLQKIIRMTICKKVDQNDNLQKKVNQNKNLQKSLSEQEFVKKIIHNENL